MHINEIVLENFKSFGRTTRLPVYEDFTVVTGPNGTGKSNIIDAVLFCLGLARTYGLRAERLPELIYNPGHEDGEDGEWTGGDREAIVEVALDNADGTLERSQVVSAAGTENVGDVSEIRIRRRIKQTEDNYYSYYYLNDRSVNLSDIQDLLAQAGVTPEGYNVVMQGDVTDITSMTPLQRRRIVDEIAGVAEFDEKKADALEELEVVRERIEEADIHIEEKRARLDELREERRTALRYRRLEREKEEYEGYLKAAELEDKRATHADLLEEIDDLEGDLEDERAELEDRQAHLEDLQDELEALNAEIQRKGEDEQLAIQREIERIRASIEGVEDQIERLEADIEDKEAEKERAFVRANGKREELEELEDEIRETKLDKAAVLSEIQDLEADREELEAELEDVDTEYDEVKAELAERREERESLREEKNELLRERDRLIDEARRRDGDIEEAERELEALDEREDELAQRQADLERELEKARDNLENIEAVVENLRGEKTELLEEIDELDGQIEGLQEEYAEASARAESGEDSSFGRAVTTVLQSDLDGVHGAIAQLGGVDPEYAEACETAAGGRMANVVVDDDGVGQRCIDLLKARNAGRATFLPISKMSTRSLPSLPDHPGVVDFASELVSFEDEYAGVFSYVLGDTLVVEDMETARELMGRYRMTTLEGDLVEKSGAMTGGSRSGSRYAFSSDGEGRLERLAKRITELTERRDGLKAERRDVDERLEAARDRRSNAADALGSIEDDLDGLEADRTELEAERESLQAHLSELEAERESVQERTTELAEEIEATDESIEAIEAAIEALQEELADSRIPELQEQIDEVNGEIERRRERLSDLEARLNELGLEKSNAENRIEELTETVQRAQNRIADLEEDIAERQATIAEHEEALDEKEAEIEAIEAELAELKDERSDLQATVDEARRERDAQRDRVSDVEATRERLVERRDELAWEIESLEDQVGDFDPEDVPDHDRLEELIAELEGDMQALQPVNMVAIERYDEVNEALADLEDNRATLEEEADAIQERIESYEAQKRETFMDAFEDIDGHFREIFSTLSEGTGRLHLEDEDDPFEGGLTMKAQPGDKPIQRLDAMSGGEKSLTALSFIFAIQRHNPAPFYALDEVDAFLDAANAERVGEMLEELSTDAQFLVVSHRAAMLERSERAIGVAMQEGNVSTVTGIDLSEGGVPADD